MKYKNYIIFVLLSLFFASCSNKPMTEEDALTYLTEHDLLEGINFYKQTRQESFFMDSLYAEVIIPIISTCDYGTIKYALKNLKGTPVYEDVEEISGIIRINILSQVLEDLNENTEYEQKIFQEEVLPVLKLAVDSIIEDNIDEVIDEYAGGILNYKKLYFFTGRNTNDFKTIWNEEVKNSSYSVFINQFTKAYLESLCSSKKDYIKSVLGENDSQPYISYSLPSFSIKLKCNMLDKVREFTEKETEEMIFDIKKDYVYPVAIGLITGGVGTVIYETGSITYDVAKIVNDVQEQKLDSNTILSYLCQEDISKQIEDQIFQDYSELVLERIVKINKETYNYIQNNI